MYKLVNVELNYFLELCIIHDYRDNTGLQLNHCVSACNLSSPTELYLAHSFVEFIVTFCCADLFTNFLTLYALIFLLLYRFKDIKVREQRL